MNTKSPLSQQKGFQRKPLIRALEQRIMLDAAAVDTAMTVAVNVGDTGSQPTDTYDDSLLNSLAAIATPAEREKSKVLVVDQGVANFEQLVAQVPDDMALVVIPAGSEGLQALVSALDGFENIEALHILSHGDEGLFQLGADQITSENVSTFSEQLAALGQVMSESGDILLYGCDLAASADGQSLLNDLAALTSADVAASDDLTGAAALGGDWALEVNSGEVEAQALAFDYGHVLSGATYYTTTAPGELDTVHDVTDSIEFNITMDGALPQESAQLTIYAFDIDEEQGEVDEVYLNGTLLGTLKGVNNQWSTTTFNISDLSLIREGDNHIEVKIDATNDDPSNPVWKAQVDWGQILIDGGSSENGSFQNSFFVESSVTNSIATVTSRATVNVETTGRYKIEAVLSDQASGNIADIVEIEFNGTRGQSLDFDINTEYDVSGGDGVCVMTFNLFYYDTDDTGAEITVLQEQSDYTFDTVQDVGPSVEPTTENTSATFFGVDGYTFELSDFPFSDADGGSLDAVIIESLPAKGTLSLNGVAVTSGAEVSATDITTGLLTYAPISGETGDNYSQFTFKVSDGLKQSESASTFSLNVESPDYIQISTDEFFQSAGQNVAGATLSPYSNEPGTTYTYSLVTGEGSTDNGLFTINGDQLHVVDSHTMAQGSYTIRVQITATGSANYVEQEVITINLTDDFGPQWQGDADPTGDVSRGDNIYHATIAEGLSAGEAIGITASAEDGSSFTYRFAESTGTVPFVIDANTGVIRVAEGEVINYESQSEYTLTVAAVDVANNETTYDFIVRVTNEAPTLVNDAQTIDNNVASVNGNVFDNDSDPGSASGSDLTVLSANSQAISTETQVSGSNGGVFILSANGEWRFDASNAFADLAAGESRTTSVTLTIEDGAGEGGNTTLEVTVRGSDNSETLVITNRQVNQSAAANTTVGVVSMETPESGISYEYRLVSGDGDTYNSGFTLNTDGTLTINDPSALPAGELSIRVQADRTSPQETSGELVYYSIEQTFIINLVDDIAPTIVGDGDSTADDGAVSGRAADGMTNGNTVGITAEVSSDETGTISYSLTDNAGGRFQIDASTGVVSVLDGSLLDSTVNSSHQITVVATDQAGNQSSGYSFTISVIEAVEPAAVDDTASTTQSRTTSGNVLNNDQDPEGQRNQLRVVAVDGNANGVANAVAGSEGGTFTISDTGNWTFQPGEDFYRLGRNVTLDTSVQVTVRDSLGLTSVSTLTVTVTGSNDSPTDVTLSETTYKTSQGDRVVGEFGVTDPDEGDSHTYRINRDNSRAFEVVGNKLMLKEGVSIASGTYTIQFVVNDTSNARVWETFDITVEDDQAPQFVDDGDADEAGDSDGALGDIPTTAVAGDLVGITAQATDNSDITYSLADDAGGRFVIDASSGVVRVATGATFDVNQNAYHDIVVRVTDEENNTGTQSFRITVTDEAPITQDDSAETTEHSTETVSGNVLTNDENPGEDNSLLRVSAVAGSDSNLGSSVAGSNGGSFVVDAQGNWTFSKGADFSDMARGTSVTTSITVTVSDSTGQTTDSTLSVTVTGENDAPTKISLSGNTIALTSENKEVGVLDTTDPDGDDGEHSYRLVNVSGQSNINDRFVIEGDRLVLRDSVTEAVSGSVYIESTDTYGATRVDSFFIQVTATATLQISGDSNSANDATDGSYNGRVREGATVGTDTGIQVSASDVSNPSAVITYELVNNEASDYFAIDASTGVITVAQAGVFDKDVARTHELIVQANSGDNAVSRTFTVAVVPDTLEAQNDTGETTESAEEAITGNIFDNDPAAQELSGPLQVTAINSVSTNVGVSVAGDNGGVFVIDANGDWQFEPAGDFEQLSNDQQLATAVTVTITNDLGDTTQTTLTVTVTGESDAPTDIALDNQLYDVSGGSEKVAGLTAVDPDTDAAGLTFTLPSGELDNGQFKIVGNELHVADGITLNAPAEYQVRLRVSDGDESYQETFTITTKDSNVPVITGDGDTAHDNEAQGLDGFIDEGYYDSNVTVGVTAVTDHGEAVTYAVLNSDALPNATDLFVIDANTGVLSVKAGATIDAETYGTLAVTVEVRDAQDDASTAVFNIAVGNQAPQANDDAQDDILGDDVTASGNALSNDSDAGSDDPTTALTVTQVEGQEGQVATAVTGSNGGQFTVNADGSWSFEPGTDFDDLAPGAFEQTQITITVSDQPVSGSAETDTSVITVTVKAPADLSLSENRHDLIESDDVVGELSAQARDWTGPFTYELVTGEGDSGNDQFVIDGTTLKLGSPAPVVGDYTVRVRVTDTQGNQTEEPMDIIIVDSTQPFILRDDNSDGDTDTYKGQVAEGSAEGTLVGITAQPDQDRSGMSYELLDDAEGKFVIDASTGVVSVAADAELNAESGGFEQSITIKASDSVTGQTDTKTFVINVTNVEMTVTDDTGTTQENPSTLVSGNVFSNDSDPSSTLPGADVQVTRVGDAGLVGQAVAGSNGGVFTLQANGDWVFDPQGDFEALASGETTTSQVTVFFEEQNMGVAATVRQTTLTITIVGENDAPTLTSTSQPSFSTEIESEFSFDLDPAKVTDVDNGHLHANRDYAIAGANGTALPSWISLNRETLSLEGTAQDAGRFLIEVTATDPDGASVSYVVEVNVAAAVEPAARPSNDNDTPEPRARQPIVINDGPTVEPLTPVEPSLPELVIEDGPAANNGAPDPVAFDPNPFGPTAAGQPEALVFRTPERELLPDGQFIEVLPNFRDTREFTLIVGIGLEDQLTTVGQSFSYQVSQAAFVFTSEGQQFVGEVSYTATQANGGALPAWLSFNREEALFTGVPDEPQDTVLEIRVTAESGDGQRATAIFQIIVNNQQDAQLSSQLLDIVVADGHLFDELPVLVQSAEASDNAAGLVNANAADEGLKAKPSLQQQLAEHAREKASDSEQQLLAQLAQLMAEQTPAS